MTTTLPRSEGLLILPHLNVQNANAISSPLTHGFPSMTAFLGLMWALERNLKDVAPRLFFDSIGVVCHGFDEQVTDDGYVRKFRLTRNPVDRDGSTAAIVEEGRIHLDITLVFGVTGHDDDNIVVADETQRKQLAARIGDVVAGMRIAGGSVLLPFAARGRRIRPELVPLADANDPDARSAQSRRLRRQWLPGFALVGRDDLLQARTAKLRKADPAASALDAWLGLSRFNWHSGRDTETGKVEWSHDRAEGWIVPIPVGYGALSDSQDPGTVRNARDPTTRFRFVESLYSIGQWIGPHRLNHPNQLLWYAHSDDSGGAFRCRNDFAPPSTTSNH
ncbi:MAG: type I-F CRISPR-associated protein Csy2 [Rhodanobacteraceae bacterium]